MRYRRLSPLRHGKQRPVRYWRQSSEIQKSESSDIQKIPVRPGDSPVRYRRVSPAI